MLTVACGHPVADGKCVRAATPRPSSCFPGVPVVPLQLAAPPPPRALWKLSADWFPISNRLGPRPPTHPWGPLQSRPHLPKLTSQNTPMLGLHGSRPRLSPGCAPGQQCRGLCPPRPQHPGPLRDELGCCLVCRPESPQHVWLSESPRRFCLCLNSFRLFLSPAGPEAL